MNCPTRRFMKKDGTLSIPVDRAVFSIKTYKPDYIVVAYVGGACYELETFETKREAVECLKEIHMRFEY